MRRAPHSSGIIVLSQMRLSIAPAVTRMSRYVLDVTAKATCSSYATAVGMMCGWLEDATKTRIALVEVGSVHLKEAKKINSSVASWYLNRIVGINIDANPPIPTYTRERMLEAFQMVERANKLRVVNNDDTTTLCCVCSDRVADMVLAARGD